MYSVPQSYIDDITVVTDVDGEDTGVVRFNVEVSGSPAAARVLLIDEDGQTVDQADGLQGSFTVPSAHLWQPGAAYLYQLQAELLSEDGSVGDVYQLPVGIRSVSVQGNKFLINNKPFYFTGFGKHEDTPVRGKGFDWSFVVHDYELMKWIGANSFRTSHYPYAEEIVSYADRHGFVIIDETAGVGLNLGVSAGGQSGNPPKTWSGEGSLNNETQAALMSNVRELIARDKNHPSVVMWSLINEPAAEEEGAREFFKPVVDLARELDPTRPLCYASILTTTVESDLIVDLFDVVALNRYFAWYVFVGDLAEAELALRADLRSWQDKVGKPIIMTEYGADTQSGLHTVLGVPWSEEFQSSFLEMYHRVFDEIDAMAGEHVWNFADFQTTSGITRVDGNKKGVFTRDRRPKTAAHTLRTRWTARDSMGWAIEG